MLGRDPFLLKVLPFDLFVPLLEPAPLPITAVCLDQEAGRGGVKDSIVSIMSLVYADIVLLETTDQPCLSADSPIIF